MAILFATQFVDSDAPPETYCLAAPELTTACMAQTLCEQKIFAVADNCQEGGDPNQVRFLPLDQLLLTSMLLTKYIYT